MRYELTTLQGMLLVGQALAQAPGGRLPDILGGNIPALQNPNAPLSSKEAMSGPGTGPYPAVRLWEDSEAPSFLIEFSISLLSQAFSIILSTHPRYFQLVAKLQSFFGAMAAVSPLVQLQLLSFSR
jgi:hypothetical protein